MTLIETHSKIHNLGEPIVIIYWQSDVYKSGYWKFAQNYYQALKTVAIAEHWDTPIILDEYCKEEIIFWKNSIYLRNFRNCFVFHKHQKVTFSDASNFACGAVTYFNGGEHVCHKMWTRDERARNFTWRELSAIEFSPLSCLWGGSRGGSGGSVEPLELNVKKKRITNAWLKKSEPTQLINTSFENDIS